MSGQRNQKKESEESIGGKTQRQIRRETDPVKNIVAEKFQTGRKTGQSLKALTHQGDRQLTVQVGLTVNIRRPSFSGVSRAVSTSKSSPAFFRNWHRSCW